MMKKTNTIILLTVLGLMTVGCAKEDRTSGPEGMRLLAEGFHQNSKAAVSGNAAYWVEGETVRINGTDYAVQVDGAGNAYVADVLRAATYRALYPNTLDADATLEDDVVTVSIPSSYTYAVSGGRQVLDVPMAAYGTSDERLEFKHITAAINVEVENRFGVDVTVDRIVVSSDSYQLSGSTTIDLSDADMGVVNNNDDVADADRKVTMLFDGGTDLHVSVGSVATVQVPVLPVGDDNHFTVEVTVHNKDDVNMTYTFERTQGTGGALPRKYLGYGRAKFGGVFSVSADKQVYFSPGNLQWSYNSGATHAVKGGGTASGTWRFAQHQYDYIGSDNSRIAYNYNGWIDLFGYGTSGASRSNNTYYPYLSDNNDNTYYGSTLVNSDYDWGVYNAISNGGNTANQWRTLTGGYQIGEWYYLLNQRDGATSKCGLATITKEDASTVQGLILLPDKWKGSSIVTTFTAGYGSNTYTESEWMAMEVLGAVFLPSAGWREGAAYTSGNGYYWSANNISSSNAYYADFTSKYIRAQANAHRYSGYSVRLVKDVQ